MALYAGGETTKNNPGNDGQSLNKKNDAKRVYPYFQYAF
ncbi:Hypothetical protein EAG7_02406 [Klebsiella aerogenes]|nr:Hypothetical protein EAG7_02406 [Klebsiella aerogenes]CCG30880.1 hypothetical protein [Klebsiella aerogenes EA1509E]